MGLLLKQKFSYQIMAVKAMLTAKDACFGFPKVETSSEHGKATSLEMESQVFQGLNQINI